MYHKVAIIQARMSSSRLPGKALMELAGKPMLQRVVERARQASTIDDLMVATTTDPSDDILQGFCHEQGIACYRGSLPDVLDRFYRAARQSSADVIIRLTADCPLLDPAILDLTVTSFLGETLPQDPASLSNAHGSNLLVDHPFDFLANRLPPPWKRTLPIGLDVEVCSRFALERAWQEAREPHQREHVMPYLYEGVSFSSASEPSRTEWFIQQGKSAYGFRIGLLSHHPDYGSLRWTVDTAEDLEFVRQVYLHLGVQAAFTWQDVLALLQREPDLGAINAAVKHKSAFDVDERTLP